MKAAARLVYRTATAAADKQYFAPNPDYGAAIYYFFKNRPEGEVTLTIRGPEGKPLAQLKAPNGPGLQRVQWNLKTTPDDPKNAAEVKPGDYAVELRG